MRALLLAMALTGCASEAQLVNGLDPDVATSPPTGGTGTVVSEPPAPGLSALRGTVCAPDGDTGVAHAKVVVQHDGGPTSVFTDGAGDFRIEELPPGTWEVVVSKGSFETTRTVELVEGETARLSIDECLPLEQGDTEIAVVTGNYDAIELLLDRLNLEYDVIPGRSGTQYVDFLRSPSDLEKYDVIFFNCGMGEQWVQYGDEIGQNLEDYVTAGGSIYASDWAYWLIETAWPAKNDFIGNEADPYGALVGAAQSIEADVLDPAMIEALGSDVADLNYDLVGWAAMEGSDAEVLIEGRYTWWDVFAQREKTAPLATRLTDGDGTALYTSFHNEQQTTVDMELLLQEIILSL